MRSNKRYTNVTFTKRVDHEAGRHRPSRAPAEPKTCQRCGAIYERRRWRAGRVLDECASAVFPTSGKTLCPACRRVLSGPPSGVLRVEGGFLRAHLDDITQLLRNEASHAAEDNPTARVMTWTTSKGPRLELTTTTPHLAQRLGHALEKTYGGHIRYRFGHENLLARVGWRRDD